jgi:crotonobetainyl-CoA:carnitine CoA-transferase CaiB-like acyl-CoA transferase
MRPRKVQSKKQEATMGGSPLQGMVVVELGHSIAAPYAGLVLAALGAEVVKVERAGVGDPVRDWGPPFTDGASTTFQTYNRGKSCVEVDFRDPAQVSDLRRFVMERGDIVLQNLKAGAADRAGLGAAELVALKPSLIYCNMHAFGAVGPLKDRPGYDPLMQAFGGLMSVTGEGGGRPPVRVGVSIIDMGAGMWAVIGILAALTERARSGKGGVVDVSLYETALGWMLWPLNAYFASGEVPGRQGSGMGTIVPYQVFPTRDSFLMVAAGNDNLFRKLCGAIEQPDWAEDRRFTTNSERVRHRSVLLPLLEAVFLTRDTADWTERLAASGVPGAALQNVAEVAVAAQTEAVGMIQRDGNATLPSIGLPLSFDGVRPHPGGPAPALGAQTETLLRRRSENP